MMEKDEKKNLYFGYECALYRMDRMNRRLWILCIMLAVLLVGSNVAWLHYEKQFATETMTVSQDITGDSFANTGIGDINYGEDKANGNNN